MCPECKDSGVIETGNNDLPCDCPAGDKAVFNTCDGQVTGRSIKKGWEDRARAPLPDYLK